MLSWPPAITMSASPALIACAARCVAFRPEPQTLLMVIAGTMSGRPARMEAWRAGFWPTPAVSTCPSMTSLTMSGFTPVLASSARNDFGAEICCGNFAYRAAELADTGAQCSDDYHVIHLRISSLGNIWNSSAAGECLEHSLTVAERRAQCTPAF